VTVFNPQSWGEKSMEGPVSRQYINVAGHDPAWPFSDGVLVGDTLHISGSIGVDPATGNLPGSIAGEVNFLLDHFQAVLAGAGMTMDDLVSVHIYSPDVSLWQAFNAEYVKRFTGPLPARAFLGAGPLIFGAHFEMVGVAVKRG
jgi:enamine deaminase RidA (YjgF/YER057c/UK114 family)